MPSFTLLVSAFFSILSVASAITTPAPLLLPATGCDSCDNYKLGIWMGSQMNADGWVNYGQYAVSTSYISKGSNGVKANSVSDCCSKCKSSSACYYYQYFNDMTGNNCFLLTGYPSNFDTNAGYSYVGGRCNPNTGPAVVAIVNSNAIVKATSPVNSTSSNNVTTNSNFTASVTSTSPGVKGDPHFTGWDGVHFDFTGQPGTSYCVVSDKSVHVNMQLEGYIAKSNGTSEVHSWIKGLAFFSSSHKLAMYARTSASPARENGYLLRMSLDGQAFTLETGSKFSTIDGELTVEYAGHHIDADDDIDEYYVTVGQHLKLRLRMRPEIPLLRLPTDSFIHFSMDVLEERLNETAHGILGQTLFNLHNPELAPSNYAVEYSGIIWAWQVVGADADSYVQGTPRDYANSNLLSPNCKFSRFSKRPVLNKLSLGCLRKAFVC